MPLFKQDKKKEEELSAHSLIEFQCHELIVLCVQYLAECYERLARIELEMYKTPLADKRTLARVDSETMSKLKELVKIIELIERQCVAPK